MLCGKHMEEREQLISLMGKSKVSNHIVETDEYDCQEETHEKDWIHKNQWKQPWNKKGSKKR